MFGCAQTVPIVLPTQSPTPATIPPIALPTSTPAQTPTPLPTKTPFIPEATIKIAVHFPLSGGRSTDGQEALQAAQLAAQQLSGPLRELGFGIELVSFDDQTNVEVSKANAREIVADPDILCGVGHFNSHVMIQASEIYHAAGLAFISPATTRSTVTDRYYVEVNRIVGRDDGQGIAAAQFANAQGYTRALVVYNNDAANKKSADYFTREAYQLGISIVGNVPTEQEANFTGIIRHVQSSNPEIIYLATNVDQAGSLIKETRAAGYLGAYIGADNIDRSGLAELAGPALTEGSGTYYTTTVASANSYPDAAQFALNFQSIYGASPRPNAAQAYDAIGICLKGIEDAVQAKNGEVPNRKEVAIAIRALLDYPGIAGHYRFNNKGDIVPAQYFIYKVASADPGAWHQNKIVSTFNIDPP